MAYPDEVVKTKECRDCSEEFDIYQGELDFLRDKFGDSFSEPVRCKPCRRKKKDVRNLENNGKSR